VRRLIVAALAAAAVLIVVAGAWAYWFFSGDGFRRALEAQSAAWIGAPVHIGAARAQFLPRIAVQLRDVRVGDPARLTLDDVELAADLRPLLAGRLENADVRVSDSRIDMPPPFASSPFDRSRCATSGCAAGAAKSWCRPIHRSTAPRSRFDASPPRRAARRSRSKGKWRCRRASTRA
jgi:hypothetical protein